MKLSKQDLEDMATFVKNALVNEFAPKHLSNNLLNTIQINFVDESKIQVSIPAQTYNMLLFQHKRVVVHTSHGSYASKLDIEGSSFFVYPNESRSGSYKVYPKNHIGYIDRVINEAISSFLAMKADKWKLRHREEI